MAVRIVSSGTLGVDGYTVDVEVDVSRGSMGYETVGLPDAAIRESRQRVKAAIANANLTFPAERVVVNLSPADVRKEGTAYDLPIALGILVASGQVKPTRLDGALFIGELSLSGELRPVRGLLTMLLSARDHGIATAVVPAANAREAEGVSGLLVIPARTLSEVIGYVVGALALPDPLPPAEAMVETRPDVDLSHIRGQSAARRAVEIAAAGGHPLLLTGPPGTGKTLLARALHGVLPRLTLDEQLEVSRVHSVAGLLSPHGGLVRSRPFRAPHHTASAAAVVGGGSGVARPGEVSLAHRGVLFLDELPEFARHVREVLRQPMESGEVTLARSGSSVRLPAAFQLVATMNPCPCGYANWPETNRRCTCTSAAVQRYAERVSGPLLDRLDLQVACPPVAASALLAEPTAEDSATVRQRVETARAVASERLRGTIFRCNADLRGEPLERHCVLGDDARALARRLLEQGTLSARGYHRVLRVARTIADLSGKGAMDVSHLAEAFALRNVKAG